MNTKRISSECNWKWYKIMLQKYHPDSTWGKCHLRNQSNRNLNILMMAKLHTTNLKPGSVGYIQKVTQTRAVTRNRRSSKLNQMEKPSLQPALSYICKAYNSYWFHLESLFLQLQDLPTHILYSVNERESECPTSSSYLDYNQILTHLCGLFSSKSTMKPGDDSLWQHLLIDKTTKLTDRCSQVHARISSICIKVNKEESIMKSHLIILFSLSFHEKIFSSERPYSH